MGFCNCSMFCCALLCVYSSFAIISMGKRELFALLCLSSWCLTIVVWLFLTMSWVCLQFVIVTGHTHLLFLFDTMHRINIDLIKSDSEKTKFRNQSNDFRLTFSSTCSYNSENNTTRFVDMLETTPFIAIEDTMSLL